MATRSIQTSYFLGKKLVKTNHAFHPNSAVLRCVDHLQHNHYEANVAEVFDSNDGALHAVFKRDMNGIKILFKREVKEDSPASS